MGKKIIDKLTISNNDKNLKSYNLEEFKDLKGCECYYSISNKGRVFSKRNLKYLKHTINHKNKVHAVSIFSDNEKKTTSVAKLMALTFLHNPNPKLYNIAILNDGNQDNLIIENISWGTKSISCRNKLKRNPELLDDFIKKGVKINNRKMNDELEKQLLKMHNLGYSLKQLEDIFPIKQCQIRRIIKKK